METFKIMPHKGVGPIQLGMSREKVHAIFGQPQTVYDQRETYLNGFMVDFDADNLVEFIELARSPHFRAELRGKCLHETPADDAVAFLSQFGATIETDTEPGYSYVFIDLQMSLWRGVLPGRNQSENDPSGRFFEAVGVAVEGYF